MNTFAQVTNNISNENIRAANQIFVEHKNQRKTISIQETEIKNLRDQNGILVDKNHNTEKKYEISEQLYKNEKKENKRLKIITIILIGLSVFLGVKK